MRINSLSIKNFRQFYENTTLDFPYSDDRNLTVIHGDNGTGKTSILNAFKWCLYGAVDFDTDDENILNDIALFETSPGSTVEAELKIIFEDENSSYNLTRTRAFQKTMANDAERFGEDKVRLIVTGEDGQSKEDKTPELTINSVLPYDLHAYFFFNGERIEKLSSSSSSDRVKAAIKGLMGLQIVEKGIEHLSKGVRKELKKEQTKNSDGELHDVNLAIEEKEASKDQIEQDLQACKDNIKKSEAEQEEVARLLKEREEVADLQTNRERLNEMLKGYENEFTHKRERQRTVLNEKAFLVLGQSVFDKAYAILEGEREKGHLPIKVKGPFLDDLLDTGVCICGRPLEQGDRSYEKVAALKNDFNDQQLENVYTEVSSDCKRVASAVEKAREDLEEINREQNELKDSQVAIREQLNELDHKIKRAGDSETKSLEDQRIGLKDSIEKNTRKKHRLEFELEDLDKELLDLEKRQKNLQSAEGKNNTLQAQIDSVTKVSSKLEALLESLTDDVRNNLSQKVDSTFKKIIRKPYNAQISEDFALEVYKNLPDGNSYLVHEKSTGESQVCSLSFIASIVSDAKEKYFKDTQFYQGGIFPLVMDSPFGALDPDYRRLVAEHIPQLADQVIILVSDSQWLGEVKDNCNNRVNASYRLEPSSFGDSQEHSSYTKIIEE